MLSHLDRLLSGCMARNESMVVEGVHLSLNAVMRLMGRHSAIVPFLVHIRHASSRTVLCVSRHPCTFPSLARDASRVQSGQLQFETVAHEKLSCGLLHHLEIPRHMSG